MSRTDAHEPWNVQSRYARDREEVHVWCENETIDTARWTGRLHGRAVYESYVVRTQWKEAQFVTMIDSNGVKFGARTTRFMERRSPSGVYYDEEEHPNAVFVYKHIWYGGEWMKVRNFYNKWIEVPQYRSRLVYWEPEPRRECDIDEPNGKCYYRSDSVKYAHDNNRENRRIMVDSPRRRYERDTLNYAKHEYNTYGYTEHEPAPRIPEDVWW